MPKRPTGRGHPTRLTFTDRNADGKVNLLGPNAEVTQHLDYYPFGMTQDMSCLYPAARSGNRYRYNGKEFSEELGLYDYGARWYDPAIGRWGQVDPKAHWYYDISPYVYVDNNPIINYDPNGEFIGTIIGAIVEGVTAAVRGEKVWTGVVSGAAAGAVADLAIATGGTSLAVMAVAGAASGATGAYVDQRLNGVSHDEVSWGNIGKSAALGGILGYAGGKINIGPALQKAHGWIGRQASRALSTRKGKITVGRWMSEEELAKMQSTGRVQEGGGGQTFVSTNGVDDFHPQAKEGSVYVEFDAPKKSMVQGGKKGCLSS